MAAHSFLTDQQIADVLTYIRNSFGNKAGVVTTAEVKKQRAKKLQLPIWPKASSHTARKNF